MDSKKKYYQTQPNPLPNDSDDLDWEDGGYPHISNVVSAQECTGMMPVLPLDEDQEDSYRDLYSSELPKEN